VLGAGRASPYGEWLFSYGPLWRSEENTLGSMWAFTGKQCRRCGMNRERAHDVQVRTYEIPLRMSIAEDSGTVVMKVETRYGVCNNSPAEAIGSENG